MTEEQHERTISRQGTGRALVLLGSALALGGAALICLGTLVFGPAVLDRHGLTGAVVLGTVAFGVSVLVSVVAANLLAVRGRTLGGVLGRGCGTLLAGILIGLALMLLLISKSA